MKTAWTKVALAAALSIPGVVGSADDQTGDDKPIVVKVEAVADAQAAATGQSDDAKQQKRVQVRVLRKDGEKPEVKIFRDGSGEELKNVQVLRLDGPVASRALKVFVNDGGDSDKPAEKQTYLGVAVEAVPAALVAQLPNVLAKEQGVLVSQVAADSPAAKAGVKEFDVIVSYDDQKLVSLDQLIKLVRADKSGREVTLSIVRGGKAEQVKVTLAEHEVPRMAAIRMLGLPGTLQEHMIELKDLADPQKSAIRGEVLKKLEEHGLKPGSGEIRKKIEERIIKPGADVQSRKNFVSLRLQSLDGDQFKAEIEFKNDKGDNVKREFEGTREEIGKQIDGDKELPDSIRTQLRRTLEVNKEGRPGAFRFLSPDGTSGTFSFSFSDDDFSNLLVPAGKNVERIIEQITDSLDAETQKQLKDALRSIEVPGKKNEPVSDQQL